MSQCIKYPDFNPGALCVLYDLNTCIDVFDIKSCKVIGTSTSRPCLRFNCPKVFILCIKIIRYCNLIFFKLSEKQLLMWVVTNRLFTQLNPSESVVVSVVSMRKPTWSIFKICSTFCLNEEAHVVNFSNLSSFCLSSIATPHG